MSNLDHIADALELVPRLVDQARDFGYLILTSGEMLDLLRILDEIPQCALAIGPEKIVSLGALVVHVLPTFPNETTNP